MEREGGRRGVGGRKNFLIIIQVLRTKFWVDKTSHGNCHLGRAHSLHTPAQIWISAQLGLAIYQVRKQKPIGGSHVSHLVTSSREVKQGSEVKG